MQGGGAFPGLRHQGNDLGDGLAGPGQPQAEFFLGQVQKFVHTRIYRQQFNGLHAV
jgi:hypothetical protein